MGKLVAESLTGNMAELDNVETQFNELDTGEVRVYVDRALTDDELQQLDTEIRKQGVTLVESVFQDARVIHINFQKRIAPLLIIAGVIGTFLAGITGVLGWQIWRTSKVGVPWWAWVLGLGAMGYLLLRKPVASAGRAAVPIAKEAGRAYVMKKVVK